MAILTNVVDQAARFFKFPATIGAGIVTLMALLQVPLLSIGWPIILTVGFGLSMIKGITDTVIGIRKLISKQGDENLRSMRQRYRDLVARYRMAPHLLTEADPALIELADATNWRGRQRARVVDGISSALTGGTIFTGALLCFFPPLAPIGVLLIVVGTFASLFAYLANPKPFFSSSHKEISPSDMVARVRKEIAKQNEKNGVQHQVVVGHVFQYEPSSALGGSTAVAGQRLGGLQQSRAGADVLEADFVDVSAAAAAATPVASDVVDEAASAAPSRSRSSSFGG